MKHTRARKMHRRATLAAQSALLLAAVGVAAAIIAPAEDATGGTSLTGSRPAATPTSALDRDGYKLVWADEFDRSGKPDPANWTSEVGFGPHRELQWYQPENARCEFGLLVIECRHEKKANPRFGAGSSDWKQARQFVDHTSASIVTSGPRKWKHGRFEMRARIGSRPGLWPSLWMLGNASTSFKPRPIARWGDPKWRAQFHTWRVDWDASHIKFFVDGSLIDSAAPKMFDSAEDSPYSLLEPQPIRLNLAVDGDASEAGFPARFEVDYVRVLQKPGQIAGG